MKKHRIVVLNPGHFHAALVLRESHPDISDEVHVYAQQGKELQAFCNFIADFNTRKKQPTSWNLVIHKGEGDPLENLLRDGNGNIAILAGKNNTKIDAIEKLNRVGYRVFADKPWVIEEKGLKSLHQAMSPARPLSMDIMTKRFEITSLLRRLFLDEPEIFGEFHISSGGPPTIFKELVHHLFKTVNGKPLKRPPWYFDVKVQGEGIVDVLTHLVDITQRITFPGEIIDFERDIHLLEARRWATQVPLEKFSLITGYSDFSDEIHRCGKNSYLDYYCNGEILYTVRNIPVHVRVVWNLEVPAGGGDIQRSVIRGTRSNLTIRQISQKNYLPELLITPHRDSDIIEESIRNVLQKNAEKYPGLDIEREGDQYLITIPKSLYTTHEEHFAEARNAFLNMIESGSEPPELRANIISKYTLLIEAKKKAFVSPFEPLMSWSA